MVEIEGEQSEWTQQMTGIRQGCPLSPYLFLVVMTVLFNDIHEQIGLELIQNRIPGATFDEVLYADDTICISTCTKTINKLIERIETLGEKYGLILNHNKCEVLTTEVNPDIHFKNRTRIEKKDQVTYLGCEINMEGNIKKEIGRRIANTMITLKKLDLFWRHSNCSTKTKIIALDAVIRAKLLYGIDSAQLNEGDLKRLDLFQLKALRKILRLNTTFIDRRNTNQKVFDLANEKIQQEGHTKTVKTSRDMYKNPKSKG